MAFDLVRLEGEDLRLCPIEQRREALMRLVAGVDGLLFSEALAAEGAVVFAKACELGLEGNRVATGGQRLSEREESQLAEDQEPEFRQDVTRASLKPSQSGGKRHMPYSSATNPTQSDPRGAI